jgi:2-deoxy-D-gluconate 3-dehydrogenase
MKLNQLFDLSGKTALVTGCSRGIGESMAIGLAEAGANIIGVSGTLKPGSNAEQQIKKSGREFTPYSIDLGTRKELYPSIAKIKSAHPVVDILINNA